MGKTAQLGTATLLAISLTTPAIGGEIKNTEEMNCPGDGTVYWARFDSKGGKYDTGSKACKKGETVKVPLEDNGGAKAIGFFQAGTKLPDPLAIEYFMSWDGTGYRLDDLAYGIYLTIGSTPYRVPLFESTVSELYAVIDMTPYLAAMPALDPTLTYDFSTGNSASLPGVRISTTEPTFSSTDGWTISPYTGQATLLAEVSGQATHIPEPTTALLGLTGLAALGALRRRRLGN